MRRDCFRLAIALLAALAPLGVLAQSGDSVPLGDLARTVRHTEQQAPAVVIDNDNLSQVTAQIENRKANSSPVFSFKATENTFRMSLPDGTCSLSFNAKATSALLAVPSVAKELPQSELAKLEGPASIKGDSLQVALYNATDWNLKEITVGLTFTRGSPDHDAAFYGAARVLPASAKENPPVGKPPDLTWLLHLKGTAGPLETAIFREKLGANVSPDQEWHWSILQARGIPPRPLSTPPASGSGLSSPGLP
jgi:hypothetical protein